MKKLFLKFALLIACSSLLIVLITLIAIFLTNNKTGLAYEVFHAREKAKVTNSDCTVAYLGDSVCNQLWSEFDEDVDGICHLGCNQAITPVGSYLLLYEYLDNNPQTKAVYLLVRPQTLANDIWLDYSYQYFVIPFLDEKNMSMLESQTKEEIYKKFGNLFVDNNTIKKLLRNNNLLMRSYLSKIQSGSEKKQKNRLSNTTRIYLKKMNDLCKEKGVEFVVKPLPLMDTAENHDWSEYENDIIRFGFEGILGGFIETIPFYPEDWFSDEVHFKSDILAEQGNEIREIVLD